MLRYANQYLLPVDAINLRKCCLTILKLVASSIM